jgi:hypothetical protein
VLHSRWLLHRRWLAGWYGIDDQRRIVADHHILGVGSNAGSNRVAAGIDRRQGRHGIGFWRLRWFHGGVCDASGLARRRVAPLLYRAQHRTQQGWRGFWPPQARRRRTRRGPAGLGGAGLGGAAGAAEFIQQQAEKVGRTNCREGNTSKLICRPYVDTSFVVYSWRDVSQLNTWQEKSHFGLIQRLRCEHGSPLPHSSEPACRFGYRRSYRKPASGRRQILL